MIINVPQVIFPLEAGIRIVMANGQPNHSEWWHPIWEFAVHVLVGSGIFVVIFAPAVLLHFFVHWLRGLIGGDGSHDTPLIITIAEYGEYTLVLFDAVMLVAFLVISTCLAIYKMYQQAMAETRSI